MSFWTILLIAVSLSMDAFAVSVAHGCRIKRPTTYDVLRPGIWFGGFQMLMPVLGWLGGVALRSYIDGVDHWIAFGLLAFVGGKMIIEAFRKDDETACEIERRSNKEMLMLAVATSIDALAVGLSLAFLKVGIWVPVIIIGVVTFAVSSGGVLLGNGVGRLLKDKAEIAGGLVLLGIGIRILVQGLRS
jgi:putative Mn2+ efflux pump MntP